MLALEHEGSSGLLCAQVELIASRTVLATGLVSSVSRQLQGQNPNEAIGSVLAEPGPGSVSCNTRRGAECFVLAGRRAAQLLPVRPSILASFLAEFLPFLFGLRNLLLLWPLELAG